MTARIETMLRNCHSDLTSAALRLGILADTLRGDSSPDSIERIIDALAELADASRARANIALAALRHEQDQGRAG
jgi:hypothetical protein